MKGQVLELSVIENKAAYAAVGQIFKDVSRERGWASTSKYRPGRYQFFRTYSVQGGPKTVACMKSMSDGGKPAIVVIDEVQRPLRQFEVDSDSIKDMIRGVNALLADLEENGVA